MLLVLGSLVMGMLGMLLLVLLLQMLWELMLGMLQIMTGRLVMLGIIIQLILQLVLMGLCRSDASTAALVT